MSSQRKMLLICLGVLDVVPEAHRRVKDAPSVDVFESSVGVAVDLRLPVVI